MHAGECKLGEITSTLVSGTTRDVYNFGNIMPIDAYCTYYPPKPTCMAIQFSNSRERDYKFY